MPGSYSHNNLTIPAKSLYLKNKGTDIYPAISIIAIVAAVGLRRSTSESQ